MCRLLCVRGDEPFDLGEHLEAFTEVARNSREFQGHGWGCAWLDSGRWRIYRNITPIWEDRRRPRGRTPLLLAHARSAFRDEGIRVANNMPFFDGERMFLFNGELRGVRIREHGRIGAEKVFNFVKRFDRGDLRSALERGLPLIEKRTRYLRAMNIVVTDASFRITVASRFNEDPDYFQMHRTTVGGASVLCSERYPEPAGPAEWTPIPNGTISPFGAGHETG